jgi:tRNA dimethylallyltransferase
LESEENNLVIILGPTGVGKSATAIKLGKLFDGEIINCDSMQVYRGFDIGTDKSLPEKRESIPHHLIDIADATNQFTAAEFVKLALKASKEILSRQHLPIIAGGTGLYIKAFLDGLFPEERKDLSVRKKLEEEAQEKGLEFLRERLMEADPTYARKIGKNDRIRIIRALEVYTTTKKPLSAHFLDTSSPAQDFFIIKIGLKLERSVLYKKIEDRVDEMFDKGIVEETQNLLKQGVQENSPPFRALGYKQVLKYLRGDITLQEAVEQTKKETRHYAKRQMTWFRKMKGIQWYSPDDFRSISQYVKNNMR